MFEPLQESPVINTALRVLGTTITYLATERETGGSYSMFELVVPPGEGMVPHLHELETEQLYVLEGQLTARLGEELLTLNTGQSVWVPRGEVHAYQSTGSLPARVLMTVSPGFLHEKFFAELGVAADVHDVFLAELGLRETAPKAPLDLAGFVQTAAKYQIETLTLD